MSFIINTSLSYISQGYLVYFFSIPFILISLFFSSLASAKTPDALIISIAPSYPSPVSELEEVEEVKKWRRPNAAIYDGLRNQPLPEEPVTLGAPSKKQAWSDVINYLSKESELDLKFEPAKSQIDFELKLAKGYYDLAYVTPLQFNAFREFPGYQAQTKRKSQPLRGMVFVKKVGAISSFSELRGATIAFPGLLNYAASVIPRESLYRLNFDITPQFLASSDLVYSEVINNQYIAGAGTEESLKAQPPEIRNSLKVVWNSPGFSPHAFVAHPKVPFFSLIKLKKAMVQMVKSQNGKDLLRHIFIQNGFEVAKDSDWDEVKHINLDIINGNTKTTNAH